MGLLASADHNSSTGGCYETQQCRGGKKKCFNGFPKALVFFAPSELKKIKYILFLEKRS